MEVNSLRRRSAVLIGYQTPIDTCRASPPKQIRTYLISDVNTLQSLFILAG